MPLRLNSPIPDFSGATEWINGTTKMSDLEGTPVLVHFWSSSCHICHENMPVMMEWRKDFGKKGLKFLAFHTPRQESDLDVETVREKIAEYKITESCGIDNNRAVLDSFQSEFLSAYFLFDREGLLRRRAAGHAGVTLLLPEIEQLLQEKPV